MRQRGQRVLTSLGKLGSTRFNESSQLDSPRNAKRRASRDEQKDRLKAKKQ